MHMNQFKQIISALMSSPSQRREAPLGEARVTNSARLFTPGETKALAKSKVHQMSRAWVTNDGWSSSLISKIWRTVRSGKGKDSKKIYVRKIIQHEEMFFKLSFKGMIRFHSNMEHDEVYGKFVLTVCICSILYFAKK